MEVRDATSAAYRVEPEAARADEDVPSGYKRTEVGVIPEVWLSFSASEVCVKIQDGTHFSPKIGGGDYFYVTSKNIGCGRVDLTNADRIDVKQHSSIYRRCDVANGDILLTKDGANTGNAALNTFDFEFSLLSSVAFLRLRPEHSASYLLQQILSREGQDRIKDEMSGNAITRLTLEKINKLRFPFPPTKIEQQAIAEALSDSDALIESLQQLIAKQRALKQGAMQALLTGRQRLPGFTGEWQAKRLGDLEQEGTIRLSRGLVISKRQIEQTPGYFPIYSSSVHNNGLFGTYGKFMFDEELITWSVDGGGDFFYRPKHKFSVTNVCGFMRADASKINYRFLAEQLRLLHGRKNFDYTLKAHPSVIRKEYEVLIPPLTEQTTIATILSDMDAGIEALETRLAKTRTLKAGMMQQLLTGRIRLV